MAGGCLFEASDPLPQGESLPTASTPALQEFPLQANLLSTPQAIQDLLHELSADVVYSYRLRAAEPHHDFCHHILTNPGPPVFAKPHLLDPEKLASAQAEFSAMEKAVIIGRSNSPWSSPLHIFKKKDGRWHRCGDYHRLNTSTVILFLISRISPSESLVPQFSPS